MTACRKDGAAPAQFIEDVDVISVDEPDPEVTPLGVKGLGEIGIVAVAAAVHKGQVSLRSGRAANGASAAAHPAATRSAPLMNAKPVAKLPVSLTR